MPTTNPSPVTSSRLHVWEVTADDSIQRVIADDEEQAQQIALAARGLSVWPHPRRVEVACVPATNPESIAMIPSRFITDADRALYRQRAEAGEDLYSYRASNPARETWNLFDTDTRIVLPPVETCWAIEGMTFLGEGRWSVQVTRGDERREIHLAVNLSADYDDDLYGHHYQARAQRRILDAVNNRAFNDADPATLEGTFH